jgi:hypothetical protein
MTQLDDIAKSVALAEKHQERLAASLVKLETRIIDIMSSGPLTDGKLFDLEWAVAARSEIRNALDATYVKTIDSIVRDYDAVAKAAEAAIGKYSEFAVLDEAVVSELQQLSFNGYNALGDEFLESVSKQVYESTLTGQTFADAVKVVQSSVDKDLGRYANQAVHDGLMDFDRSVNTNIALNAGAEKFIYVGPTDEVTREHCNRHAGNTLTIDEINDAWDSSWSGKREGSPFVVAGGFNCRHRWRPVF